MYDLITSIAVRHVSYNVVKEISDSKIFVILFIFSSRESGTSNPILARCVVCELIYFVKRNVNSIYTVNYMYKPMCHAYMMTFTESNFQ